jgi:pimeloyl-ACP methyl ester carboxylesterase
MEHKLTLERTPLGPVRPVATHQVRGSGGVRLHAREWGNRSGRAILFIHGWSQCGACWTKQVSGALAERFRMVTLDIRGHGLSENGGVVLGHLTDPSLDIPSTATVAAGRLWAVNLRFTTSVEPSTPYWITQLPLRPSAPDAAHDTEGRGGER